MRLRVDQLDNHLQRSLQNLYFVSGDEPLQLMECLDQIRSVARQQQYEERIVLNVEPNFDWNRLHEECASLSLFSSQKIIELKLNEQKPGRDGGKALQEFASAIPEGILLLISAAKVDKSAQSTKWFKALEKAGAIIQIWPVDAAQLPNWLQQRAKKLGKSLDPGAAEFITARVEGNLMAASQEIEKLALLVDEDEIHMEDVLTTVIDNARYDVFSMMDSAYAGDIDKSRRMLEGLRSEGLDLMPVYGGLMWEYRRLCSIAYDYQEHGNLEKSFSEYRIWGDQKKFAIKKVLLRHKIGKLQHLLSDLVKIDRMIKSSDRTFAWSALLNFLIDLSGQEMSFSYS